MNKEEWIDRAKVKLEKWDSKVKELEARATALKEKAKADYHQTLGEAREHLGHARQHVEKAEEISGDAWDDVKENVEESWRSEKEAFDKAVAELRS